MRVAVALLSGTAPVVDVGRFTRPEEHPPLPRSGMSGTGSMLLRYGG